MIENIKDYVVLKNNETILKVNTLVSDPKKALNSSGEIIYHSTCSVIEIPVNGYYRMKIMKWAQNSIGATNKFIDADGADINIFYFNSKSEEVIEVPQNADKLLMTINDLYDYDIKLYSDIAETYDNIIAITDELNNKIDKIQITKSSVNLFNNKNITLGAYMTNSGSVTPNGGYNYFSIDTKPNTTYCITNYFGFIAFFNEYNKNIGGINNSGRHTDATFETPEGCVRAVVTVENTVDLSKYMVVEGTEMPNYYIPNKQLLDTEKVSYDNLTANILHGKTLNVLGDSMTSGQGVKLNERWDTLIAYRNGMRVNNYGIGGTLLSHSSNNNGMIDRYQSMDDNADYVLVYGGTNDDFSNVTIGTIDDTSTTTFYGALNTICEGLITKYPESKIGFITPHKRVRQQYINAIIEVCEKYSIPVFNNSKMGGICWRNTAQNSLLIQSDNIHLTAKGHKFVSTKYEAFLRSI